MNQTKYKNILSHDIKTRTGSDNSSMTLTLLLTSGHSASSISYMVLALLYAMGLFWVGNNLDVIQTWVKNKIHIQKK